MPTPVPRCLPKKFRGLAALITRAAAPSPCVASWACRCPMPPGTRSLPTFVLCSTELNQAGLNLDTLSMGMTADLETAVECGATLVRVGTALFGPRPQR